MSLTETSNSGIIAENITIGLLLKKMLAPAATDPSHVMSYFVAIAIFGAKKVLNIQSIAGLMLCSTFLNVFHLSNVKSFSMIIESHVNSGLSLYLKCFFLRLSPT